MRLSEVRKFEWLQMLLLPRAGGRGPRTWWLCGPLTLVSLQNSGYISG